jgi:hypothetical protein
MVETEPGQLHASPGNGENFRVLLDPWHWMLIGAVS